MDKLRLFALGVVSALAPIQAAMTTVFGLIIADLITGVLAAKKRGEPVMSSKLKKTIGKLIIYELTIIAAFFVGEYLTGPSIPILNMVASIIGITELQSLLENFRAISGDAVLPAILGAISAQSKKESGSDSLSSSDKTN